MKIFFCLLMLSVAINAYAQADNVELGDSRESVLEKLGVPTEIKEIQVKDKAFITYYYRNIDFSYVIDKQLNIVCEQAIGKTEGICYPCDYGLGAGACS